MDYIPRPKVQRVAQDLDDLIEIHLERIVAAPGDPERRRALHSAMLGAYEAGIDAQRAVLLSPPPTPLPPPG
jgi:hypothetical protein